MTSAQTCDIITSMPRERCNLSEDQVKIILDGVKNDVDYKDIADQVGISAMSVTNFMNLMLVKSFHEAMDSRREEGAV